MHFLVPADWQGGPETPREALLVGRPRLAGARFLFKWLL